MIDKIKDLFHEHSWLGPGDLVKLAAVIKIKTISKGEHLVREGEYNYYGYRVIKGLLAHYIIDENGQERILLFVPEKRFSGALQPTMNNKPADENIIALENCILVACDTRELERLAAENSRIFKLYNQSLKDIILDSALRIKFLLANSPEEAYRHFTRVYPNLEHRIKQKDLASFLGVTVSSLSRMRARIAKK